MITSLIFYAIKKHWHALRTGSEFI